MMPRCHWKAWLVLARRLPCGAAAAFAVLGEGRSRPG